MPQGHTQVAEGPHPAQVHLHSQPLEYSILWIVTVCSSVTQMAVTLMSPGQLNPPTLTILELHRTVSLF